MNPDVVKLSNSAVEAVAAEQELVIYRAELSEYNPTSNKFCRINLPVASKAWIDWSDSVLSLKLVNRSFASGGNATHSQIQTQLSNLIKSVSVYNNQNELIEVVQNYNLISNIVDDYTMSTTHKKSVEQIMAGGSPDGDPANAVAIAGTAATSETDSGTLVLTEKLMTGFTAGTYLAPMGYGIGAQCSIVIELEDPATALKLNNTTNTIAAYRVTDVQLRAKQIRFNSQFNETFEQSLAAAADVGVNYVSETFVHNQGSLSSGSSGQLNVNFSANPRSAKYMLACIRLEADVTDKMKYSLGVRSSGATTSYQWEINGKLLPNQPIDVSNANYSNAFAQVSDCFGMVGALNSDTLVEQGASPGNKLFYSETQATAQKFVAGLVLEDFNSATSPSTYSGLNLSNVGTMAFRPKLGASLSGNHRVDIFTSCDISFHFTIGGSIYSIR
tara:strand:+ start:92 stop:1423 length:1332 start_codon:yes stop_codon:yes gene_type:complete